MSKVDQVGYIMGHEVIDAVHRIGAQGRKSGDFTQQMGGHRKGVKARTVSFAVRGK